MVFKKDGKQAQLRIDKRHNDDYDFVMEKRVLTLELAVEQNTKVCERLDRSVAHLTQAMADLRVQMVQGHADLRKEFAADLATLRKEISADQATFRKEISADQATLRKELAADQATLRKEITASQTQARQEMIAALAETRKFVEQKFVWLFTSYCGALIAALGFLAKYLIDGFAN